MIGAGSMHVNSLDFSCSIDNSAHLVSRSYPSPLCTVIGDMTGDMIGAEQGIPLPGNFGVSEKNILLVSALSELLIAKVIQESGEELKA